MPIPTTNPNDIAREAIQVKNTILQAQIEETIGVYNYAHEAGRKSVGFRCPNGHNIKDWKRYQYYTKVGVCLDCECVRESHD